MYSDEIQEILKDNNIDGVFAIDTLPRKPIKAGVVNFDKFLSNGTHWVCYFIDGNNADYFDSFGRAPPEEILKLLKNKNIVYNSFEIQDIKSSECGLLCILYLKCRYKGMKALDIILELYQKKIQYGGNIIDTTYKDPSTGYSSAKELHKKINNKDISVKDVQNYLDKERTYQLHKPIKHKFETRRVYVPKSNDQFQADLVDMTKYSKINKGFKFILTCIDCFNKYCWAIPLKNKTNPEVIRGFKIIFEDTIPLRIQTDGGTEFVGKLTQKLFKDHKVKWFQTYNDTKAQIVERFNRTLKDKMWEYFTENNTHVGRSPSTQCVWYDIIDKLIDNCRNSSHRSIGMTPNEARRDENQKKVYDNLYGNIESSTRNKFYIDDRVRITVKRNIFRKGYLPNFTDEVYIIKEILPTSPVTYRLKDKKDEDIIGSFYEAEMVKVPVTYKVPVIH
jgi:hypothetical protein